MSVTSSTKGPEISLSMADKLANTPNKEGTLSSSVKNRTAEKRASNSRSPILTRSKSRGVDDLETVLSSALPTRKAKRTSNDSEHNQNIGASHKKAKANDEVEISQQASHSTKLSHKQGTSKSTSSLPVNEAAGTSADCSRTRGVAANHKRSHSNSKTGNSVHSNSKRGKVYSKSSETLKAEEEGASTSKVSSIDTSKPSTSKQSAEALGMDQNGGNDPSNTTTNSNSSSSSSTSNTNAAQLNDLGLNPSTSNFFGTESYLLNDFDGDESDMSRLQTILENRLHPHLLGMPRMQSFLYRSFNNTSSTSKAQQLIQGLTTTNNDTEKLQCVLDLCQMLLMGNEDTLVGFPTKTVVPALITLLSNDSNFEIMHHACRALTYMMEALPRTSLIVLDAVPVFLEKLQVIQCMDVAEQSLSALEMLSRRHNKSILHARGVAACLTYLDFFSIDAQRSALTITANCFQNLTNEDFQYVQDSLSILSAHLTVDDKKCLESICLAFSRLIDCYQGDCAIISEVASPKLLTNVQNVLMMVPPVLSPNSFMTVTRMLSIACSSCPQIAVELLKLNICETLKSLLLNNSGTDKGDSINLISRGTQEIFEITSLIAELMPVLPLHGIFSVDTICGRPNRATGEQFIWQWRDERNMWQSFNAVDSKIIEAAHAAGEDELELSSSNRSYIIDFHTMHKIYEDTHIPHSVQRKVVANNNPELANRSNMQDSDPRAEFIANEKELSTTFIKFIFGVLNEVYNNSAGFAVRYKCLNAILRILYYSPKDLLITILKDHSISSSIATMLASSDLRVVVSATQMCHILVEKLPDIFSVYFQREGVIHQIRRLYMEESRFNDKAHNTPDKKAGIKAGTLLLSNSSSSLMLDPSSGIIIQNAVQADPLTEHAAAASGASSKASTRSTEQTTTTSEESTSTKQSKRTKKNANPHGSSRSGASSIKVSDPADKKAPEASGSMPAIFASNELAAALTSNIGTSLTSFPMFAENHITPASSSKSGGSSTLKSSSSSKDFLQRLNPTKWAKWSQGNAAAVAAAAAVVSSSVSSNASAASGSSSAKEYLSLHKAQSQNREKIKAWIKEQAKRFDTTYFNKTTDDQKMVGNSKNVLLDLANSIESLKQDPLKALAGIKNILLESDLSSFELIHSGLVKDLLAFLVNKDNGEAAREQNIRIFLHIFYGTSLAEHIDTYDELSVDSKPLSILVNKLNACVSQLEQFPLRVHDFSGSLASRAASGSAGQPIRYIGAHLKISLNRHPSCVNLRRYRGPMIKLDAFTPISSVERFLIGRGYGKVKDEDEQSDEDISDEEIMENLSLSGSQSTKRQRVQLLIGDHVLPYNMSIYQAIKTYLGNEYHETEGDLADGNSKFWSSTFFLYYRLPTENNNNNSSASAASTSGARSTNCRKSKCKSAAKKKDELWLDGKVPPNLSPLDAYLKSSLTCNLTITDQSVETLCLLRVLYGIIRFWGYLYRLPYNYSPAIPLKEFINYKLTVKANRQLQDLLAIMTNTLPTWLSELAYACPFMFPFETRHLLFYVVCFDRDRALQRLSEISPELTLDSRDRNNYLPRLEKRRKTVTRGDIYKSAESLFFELGNNSKPMLEIQYENEVGTGLGPTLEFYALVSKEFQRDEFEMWKKEVANHDAKTDNFISSTNGLFPLPIGRNLKVTSVNKLKQRFKLLGKFMAKALMDSRMIDIPLNTLFYKWLLNEESTLTIANISQIDPTFSMSIIQMFKIAQKKVRENLKDNDDSLKLSGCSISDLQLDFTLPGYPSIEMRKGGKELTVDVGNLDNYINLVCHWNLVEGVTRQMEAFKEGFNSVFNTSHLLLFYPEELQKLFCGSSYKSWDYQMLMESCKTDHGFTHDSQAIRFLFEILSTYNAEEQRKFLQFLTGSPRLPIGGFKALIPAFTIVRKNTDDGESPNCLPSVMTCVNYLKLPDYPTIEIMREKLNIAINEGQFSFHLS